MTDSIDDKLAAYKAATTDAPDVREKLVELVEEWPIDGRAQKTERVRRELVNAIKAEQVNTTDVVLFTLPRLIEVVGDLEARLTGLDGDRPLNTIGL
ncbi:hypothetical protein QMK17_13025 [Rhodococcus sp. G-MC3]|uniref:hypothetical protein n=1 Tax=Rhodococcus sp. G-MC3 TaxID=3046209 RepID=UPI0024BB1D71|nr:hypothetical protein [Rhodococcus sp. G-MC3]MDJ0394249.1 hypothetical protein [Rhodococcus sp. G-MC3]